MGVQAKLIVYAPDQETAERGCRAAFARIEALEASMSDYRRGSELLRLCEKAGGPPVKVSDDLFYILQRSQQFSQESDGAFDCTVGPQVALWRQARKTHTLPTTQQIEHANAVTGYRLLQLDPQSKTVRLLKPGMKLDLGGIAKGYAGDQAIKVLRDNGIKSALFEAGGDIVVSDPPPHSSGWVIALENAGNAPGKQTLHNCAISTSGDTVQFVEIAGQHYSHVVDPRTGRALTNHWMATVIAPRGIDTDALSTTLCVMGPPGLSILKPYNARAYLRQVTSNK